tara:strand:- start:652 stop:993 length:342 start_codon:yes stop_codon:yes gene_type:complete
MSTIFKKIIDKEIDADIIYEDKNILCFKDISAKAPIHLLIIPKKEIKTINDIEEDDKVLIGEMFIAAKKIAEKLQIKEKGYRLVFNCNEDGGQTVFHLHMHLLAGRKLTWPPG